MLGFVKRKFTAYSQNVQNSTQPTIIFRSIVEYPLVNTIGEWSRSYISTIDIGALNRSSISTIDIGVLSREFDLPLFLTFDFFQFCMIRINNFSTNIKLNHDRISFTNTQ